jgi:hypothetical protein
MKKLFVLLTLIVLTTVSGLLLGCCSVQHEEHSPYVPRHMPGPLDELHKSWDDEVFKEKDVLFD